MKNSRAFIWILVIIVSCSSGKGFWELSDGDMRLQLMDMDSGPEGVETQSFRFRIYPGKAISDRMDAEARSAMWYKMDSSVYLLTGAGKIYPIAIEPVSNGVKNSFEYLILFENTVAKVKDLSLVYQDNYLTRKSYSFILNKE